MADEIFQGEWGDLIAHHDLHGRKVLVIVLDEEQEESEVFGDNPDNPWLRSLLAWANSHKPLGHPADDSRESIYSGTIDDPR